MIMEYVICSNTTVAALKNYTNLLTVFLHEIAPLTDAYVLDFFVEKHWEKIPASWQKILGHIEPQDLGRLLNVNETMKYAEVWPLSLQAFRVAAFSFTLPRKAVDSPKPIEEFLRKVLCIENLNKEILKWKPANEEFKNGSGHHKDLNHICRRHVKPKKQHEIVRLAQLTNLVLQILDVDYVLDIGSGQGHLSRLLSLHYGLNVATVEAEQSHIFGARNFDIQAFSEVQKQQNKDCHVNGYEPSANIQKTNTWTLPQHLEAFISVKSSNECLKKIAEQAWCKSSDKVKNMKKISSANEWDYMSTGLHTCGNLASTLLRLFVETSQAQVLLSVGCCYMKLDTEIGVATYPLSEFVLTLPYHNLTYEAREVSCHALEMYIERLKENAESLKIHCYRAVLEELIVKHYPCMKHTGLRSVRHAEKLDFPEYVAKAVRKCSICIPEEDIFSSETESNIQQWKKVIVFYSLRLLIAPVIESLILLDRMLYLYEKGLPSCLIPTFDPSLSPRNHVLVAVKKFFNNMDEANGKTCENQNDVASVYQI